LTGEVFGLNHQVCHSHLPLFVLCVEDNLFDGRKGVSDGTSRQSHRTQGGPFRAFAYRLSRRRFGEVVEPLTVLAHHPKLLAGYGMMELAFERSKLLDEHLKGLAMLKWRPWSAVNSA
jgi:hypothetical protein